MRPEPQPRSPTTTSGSSSAGSELQIARRAEQLAAQAIPLVGDVGEERLGVAHAALQHLLAPAQVELHGHRLREVFAHDLPEAPRALVELVDRERVAATRAVAARGDPARVGQQLEMPGDRRLRQRERVAELDDRQLDAAQAQQHAPARSVGEQAEIAREGAAQGSWWRCERLPSVNPDYSESGL